MTNEFLDYPVGTVFKKVFDNTTCYYIVGWYFIYCNDYECPQIRPHKFDISLCEIANNEEKAKFIQDLEKNNLIWNEETGQVERKYEERTLSVKVQVEPGMGLNQLLDILNLQIKNPSGIYNMKFEDF